MAWVSATFGAIAALLLAVLAFVLGDWPLWLVILLSPFAAVMIAAGVLALLYWRSTAASPVDSHQPRQPSKTPRSLHPDVL